MKTLILAPFSPYPLIFGGAIRLYNFIRMFSEISELTLLAYASTPDTDLSEINLRAYCKEVIFVHSRPLNKQKKWVLQARSFLSLKSFQYFSHYSTDFQEAFDDLMLKGEFDCIITDFSQMGHFSYRYRPLLKVLDLHNIEYELLSRRARVESRWLKKLALTIETWKFKREELKICKQFDLIFTASERERQQLSQVIPDVKIEALPNSVDTDYFALRPPDTAEYAPNEIVFIGTTHVDANRDGVCYFVDKIFPLIEAKVPDVHFTIVGGNPPKVISDYAQRPNITVTGFVEDVRPYMARAIVQVVPLRSGGGTRLKVLEGLSFGIATVSTSVGTEGIDVVDYQHVLLADTPQDFADRVVEILGSRNLQNHLRNRGRELVEKKYSWQAVGKDLELYIKTALSSRDYINPMVIKD